MRRLLTALAAVSIAASVLPVAAEAQQRQRQRGSSGQQAEACLNKGRLDVLRNQILNETAQKGIVAAVATTSKRRRFLQTVLASKGIRNAVVAYEEISAKSKPYIIGVA